jgi:hypothetical protein
MRDEDAKTQGRGDAEKGGAEKRLRGEKATRKRDSRRVPASPCHRVLLHPLSLILRSSLPLKKPSTKMPFLVADYPK